MADLYAECDWGGRTVSLFLPELPDEIAVRRMDGRNRSVYSARVHRYLPERTARRARVTVDERRTIGHDECGACGATVGMADRFCRMCGARLEGDE